MGLFGNLFKSGLSSERMYTFSGWTTEETAASLAGLAIVAKNDPSIHFKDVPYTRLLEVLRDHRGTKNELIELASVLKLCADATGKSDDPDIRRISGQVESAYMKIVRSMAQNS